MDIKNRQVIEEIIEFIKLINIANKYKIILNFNAVILFFFLSPELF